MKLYQYIYIAIIAFLVGLNVSLWLGSPNLGDVIPNLGGGKKEWEKKGSPLKLKADKKEILKAYKYKISDNLPIASTTLLGSLEEEYEILYSYYGQELYQEIKIIDGVIVNEDITKRQSDYQQFIGSNGMVYHQFRSGDKFGLDESDWKVIDWATTTEEAYIDQTGLNFVDEIIARTTPYVLADTFVPITNGDNSEWCGCTGKSWSTCQSSTSEVARSTANLYIQSYIGSTANESCIERGQLVFDTSTLSGCTVGSASLAFHGVGIGTIGTYGNTTFNVYKDNVENDAPTNTDFNDCGTTAFSDSGIIVSSWNSSAGRNNNFNFNSSGISGVSSSGKTYLCVRDSYYDTPNNVPPTNTGSYIGFAGSRTSGTSDDPLLTVTCGAVASAVPNNDIIIFE